mgnify:CR=1 FL=1
MGLSFDLDSCSCDCYFRDDRIVAGGEVYLLVKDLLRSVCNTGGGPFF